jgi:synaptonemal complex protein 3
MLERFAANISKALLAKSKGLEMYTEASLEASSQKNQMCLESTEQSQKLNQEYCQQFQTLFQQWDINLQNAEEEEGN